MTGIFFILFIPVVFIIAALKLSSSAKRDFPHGDGGYSGHYDGGQDYADSPDSGFGGGDSGGGE